MKVATYKGLVRPVLEYGLSVWGSHTKELHDELEMVRNCAVRFLTRTYVYATWDMTGILGQLQWESQTHFVKGLKGKTRIPTDDLIPKIRRHRNQYSTAFQTPSASKNTYKCNFFPQI